MSVVEIYLEDGPEELAGTTHAHESAPPTLKWITPRKDSMRFRPMGAADDVVIQTDTLTYHREHAPYRSGVVCYWLDPAARDRAYFEDYEVVDPADYDPNRWNLH